MTTQDDSQYAELLDKRSVARVLRISQRTLDNRIAAGTIPFVKIGKVVRFIPSDIQQFIASHRVG